MGLHGLPNKVHLVGLLPTDEEGTPYDILVCGAGLNVGAIIIIEIEWG